MAESFMMVFEVVPSKRQAINSWGGRWFSVAHAPFLARGGWGKTEKEGGKRISVGWAKCERGLEELVAPSGGPFVDAKTLSNDVRRTPSSLFRFTPQDGMHNAFRKLLARHTRGPDPEWWARQGFWRLPMGFADTLLIFAVLRGVDGGTQILERQELFATHILTGNIRPGTGVKVIRQSPTRREAHGMKPLRLAFRCL